MAYTNEQTILTYINGRDIINFLDDDSDGQPDDGLLDSIIATCSAEVDGYLSGIYQTPFTGNIPRTVEISTTIFVCEALYARRLTPDEKNPFKTRADMWRKVLNDIRENGSGLDYTVDRAFEPGSVSTCPVVINATTM
jgi:phage gp36-like protein